MNTTELAEMMKTKAELVQAQVSDVTGLDEIFRYTVDLTKKQGGKTIAAPGLTAAESETLAALCEKEGLTLLLPPYRDNLNGIHTGLTTAHRGIAETGTLVIHSASEDLRIATMLSETHVAWLPKEKILENTDVFADEMDDALKKDPTYVAFITGPSRTADIERVLSIGVHGPKELHILLKEENL